LALSGASSCKDSALGRLVSAFKRDYFKLNLFVVVLANRTMYGIGACLSKRRNHSGVSLYANRLPPVLLKVVSVGHSNSIGCANVNANTFVVGVKVLGDEYIFAKL
jgi:hypothetical protein